MEWRFRRPCSLEKRTAPNGQEAARARPEEGRVGAAAPGCVLGRRRGYVMPAEITASSWIVRRERRAGSLSAAGGGGMAGGAGWQRLCPLRLGPSAPLDQAMARWGPLTDGQAMVARILLIHEYPPAVLRYCLAANQNFCRRTGRAKRRST